MLTSDLILKHLSKKNKNKTFKKPTDFKRRVRVRGGNTNCCGNWNTCGDTWQNQNVWLSLEKKKRFTAFSKLPLTQIPGLYLSGVLKVLTPNKTRDIITILSVEVNTCVTPWSDTLKLHKLPNVALNIHLIADKKWQEKLKSAKCFFHLIFSDYEKKGAVSPHLKNN